VVPNLFEVGEHLQMKNKSWNTMMANTNFWEHLLVSSWEKFEENSDTWVFREHLMKILGALLVPGALIGKH
jgi:hypothetical protein